MASIIIRKLDESTKNKLRMRAAQNNRSMEDEARNILKTALSEGAVSSDNLAASIHKRFKAVGGVDLQLPPREPMRSPPRLEK